MVPDWDCVHSGLCFLGSCTQSVDRVNNLQSLMNSCRDVSNNDTYDEIHRKAVDMVKPKEISMPRNVKHRTMRCNVPTESPKNYYLRDLY